MEAERGVHELVEHLFRRQAGQMLATLTHVFGLEHLDLAEEPVSVVADHRFGNGIAKACFSHDPIGALNVAPFSRYLAPIPGGERFARAGLRFRYQGLKLRIGRQQFIEETVILLGIERLNCQEPLIRHLDDDSFPRVGALIQSLLEIRFQTTQRDGLDGHGTPLLPQSTYCRLSDRR
jgi:hypothetical protein